MAGLAVLGGAGTAWAHQPVFVDDAASSGVPLIEDGKVSFAVYGRIEQAGGAVRFQVRHGEGEELRVEVLVPDRSPERERDAHDALTLAVEAPDGSVAEATADRVLATFDEPFTSTRYLRVLEWSAPAQPGVTTISLRSVVPTRVVVVTGVLETVGAVSGYTGSGVEALAEWYAEPVPGSEAAPAGGPGAGEAQPPVTAGPSPINDAGLQRDVIGRSGGGWPMVGAYVGLLVVLSLLALRPWRRRTLARAARHGQPPGAPDPPATSPG